MSRVFIYLASRTQCSHRPVPLGRSATSSYAPFLVLIIVDQKTKIQTVFLVNSETLFSKKLFTGNVGNYFAEGRTNRYLLLFVKRNNEPERIARIDIRRGTVAYSREFMKRQNILKVHNRIPEFKWLEQPERLTFRLRSFKFENHYVYHFSPIEKRYSFCHIVLLKDGSLIIFRSPNCDGKGDSLEDVVRDLDEGLKNNKNTSKWNHCLFSSCSLFFNSLSEYFTSFEKGKSTLSERYSRVVWAFSYSRRKK